MVVAKIVLGAGSVRFSPGKDDACVLLAVIYGVSNIVRVVPVVLRFDAR